MFNNDVKKGWLDICRRNHFRASQNNFQIIKDLNLKNQIVKTLREINVNIDLIFG